MLQKDGESYELFKNFVKDDDIVEVRLKEQMRIEDAIAEASPISGSKKPKTH